MACFVCKGRPATIGLLCEDCRDELASPRRLVPQQILATIVKPADGALIDQWGRAHPLEPRTLLGRAIDGLGILILEASISRHHAHLVRDRETGAWSVRDLGSANGTFVNDQPTDAAVQVSHGDRLTFGTVGFYLVTGLGEIPHVPVDPAAITTVRPAEQAAAINALPPTDDATTETPLPSLPDFSEREDTDVGLPTVAMRFIEPTGGGGGYVEIGGVRAQLTAPQLELITVLARRMTDEADQPTQVRGFVRGSELLATISWDTRGPDEGHVKQLVRRVRRVLVRAGLGELVESRHRFGYRLRLIPRQP